MRALRRAPRRREGGGADEHGPGRERDRDEVPKRRERPRRPELGPRSQEARRADLLRRADRVAAPAPTSAATPFPSDESANVAYFEHVMREAGLTRHVRAHLRRRSRDAVASRIARCWMSPKAADLLLNISGHLTLEPLMRRLRRKAYLDLDPGYTQFWHASGTRRRPRERPRFPFHDRREHRHARMQRFRPVISAGATRASPWCSRATPCVSAPWTGRFTTIASWRGPYGPVRHGSTTFGLKVHEFRKLVELPQRTSADLRDRSRHSSGRRTRPGSASRPRMASRRSAASGPRSALVR